MKILCLAWFYYPKIGGVESVSKIINGKLIEKGHEVIVVTSGEKEEFEMVDGVKVIRTPKLIPGQRIGPEFKIWARDLISQNFDLVHCHNFSYNFNPEKSLEILKVCRELKIPNIEHAHNAQLKCSEKTREIILSSWSRIICVSNFVKKRFIELGVDSKKIKVIHNPLDLDLFDPKKVDEDEVKKLKLDIAKEGEVIIFFPGRVVRMSLDEFGEQKQFKSVVYALKILKEKGIKFKLIIPSVKGSMSLVDCRENKREKIVDDFLKENGIYENVYIFPRDLKLENMPLVYQACDIVCLPSLKETFGMVYLEGQAMGKVVIGARSGGVSEVIDEGKTGFLIEEKNVKELANYLEKLSTHKKLREVMGKRGKKRVKELFNKEKMIKNLLKIYKNILKN